MWARTGIEFMKLCSCQGTLNPDFHHQHPVTSEPKNKTVDGVRRIQENTGLRIIWGWILKQLHETTPLFNLIMIQESRKFALENFMISSHQNFNFIIRMMISFLFFYTEIIGVFFIIFLYNIGSGYY